MATSVIEQLRADQEEVENLSKCIVKLVEEREKKPKHRLTYDNAAKERLLLMQEKAQHCLELYKDADNVKSEEISFLAGQNHDRTGKKMIDVWTNFYDRLKNIKDYYRKFENVNTIPEIRDAQVLMDEAMKNNDLELLFSSEEHLGKFLDMNEFYLQFINIPKLQSYKHNQHRLSEFTRLRKHHPTKEPKQLEELMEPFEEVDYITYLKTFERFHEIPRYCKYRDESYELYLQAVADYLEDYFVRQNPLANHEQLTLKFQEEFEKRWESKHIMEWETLSYQLPLFVLPTDKLFASQGPYNSHLTGKKYQKMLLQFQEKSLEEQAAATTLSMKYDKSIAKLEAFIQRYKDLLSETFERTIEHLQKKQSRSDRELIDQEEESEGEEIDPMKLAGEIQNEDSEDEDDEKPVYNPLNLPLGWDGKPIPFWLYKLHGLGTEFKCEICGNYSYWGRRAFERHFQEWRHAFGMRSLKIPNTVHFKEITRIEDAITLYEKLKKQADFNAFMSEHEIECEDSQGNVMSARAYDDLRRQGLL
ncbi:putative splicesome-associated protein [Cardiosporidium cionae]|uniref:Splicesome-associated protein n=1 Tax=Cardiosporidium cionae TaxID=476202 RepID=A0ABQ7JCJ6_9APIC|nr:putative splicesome-associated protein [Cardiosporidium cionae]|eukprot:KAF8821742.1 putative splicesome-associated protein [Cardiosporidium cionae]